MGSVQLASFETHRGHPVGTGRNGTGRKITKMGTDNHVNLGVRGWSPRSAVFMVILTKFLFLFAQVMMQGSVKRPSSFDQLRLSKDDGKAYTFKIRGW